MPDSANFHVFVIFFLFLFVFSYMFFSKKDEDQIDSQALKKKTMIVNGTPLSCFPLSSPLLFSPLLRLQLYVTYTFSFMVLGSFYFIWISLAFGKNVNIVSYKGIGQLRVLNFFSWPSLYHPSPIRCSNLTTRGSIYLPLVFLTLVVLISVKHKEKIRIKIHA